MRLEHLLSREKKVCTIGFYRRLEPFNFVLYYIDTVSLSIGKRLDGLNVQLVS